MHIKNKIFIVFSILFSTPMFSQDTIIKLNKEKVLGKIIKINFIDIEYLNSELNYTSKYSVLKSEVEKVIYSSGKIIYINKPEETLLKDYYELGILRDPIIIQKKKKYYFHEQRINELQLHNQLNSIRENQVSKLVSKASNARRLQKIGFVGIPFGIYAYSNLLKWEIMVLQNKNTKGFDSYLIRSGIFAGIALVFPAISIIFKANRNRNNREAVKLYNQKF